MLPNLERYREDLRKLITTGQMLEWAMQRAYNAEDFDRQIEQQLGKEGAENLTKALPNFMKEYQAWYSESKAVVRQLMPDRLDDFVRHYEKPKSRKDITYENYRIEDYLQGLTVTRSGL
jgi:hypothetical protein